VSFFVGGFPAGGSGQRLLQFFPHLLGGGALVLRLLQRGALLRQRVLVGLAVGEVLRVDLREQLGRIVRAPRERRVGKLRVRCAAARCRLFW